MKKQIAILATMLAASGFTAFGQDWVLFSSASITKEVWDESTTAGVGTIGDTSGLYDVSFLWAATGTSDPLANIGTELAQNSPAGVTPTAAVATNGVTSVGSALSTIATMLSSGWSIATNISSGSGTAASGLADTLTSTSGKITGYNPASGVASPFELEGGTGVSGSSIELIVIAWNVGANLGTGTSTFANVSAFGYDSPFTITVGSNAGDGNINSSFNTLGYDSFGVAPAAVPEPTTLALAGLGGLSMLFLRRRKA